MTEQEFRNHLRIVREAMHAVSGTLQSVGVIQMLLEQIVAGLGARGALVRLLSPDATELTLVGAVGLSERYLNKGSVQINESGVDQRALAGNTVLVRDVTCEPGFHYQEEARCEGLRGMVSVPLVVRNRAVGVLRAYVDDVDTLGEEGMLTLQILADLGAVMLEKVGLHQSLYRIAQTLNSSLKLESILVPVLEEATREIGSRSASVRLLDKKGQKLQLVAAYNLSAAYLKKGDVIVAESPLDQRVLRGETVALYDVVAEPGLQYPAEAAREGIRSMLAVPLRLKDKVLGVMRVYSAQPRRYGAVATDFLLSVASLVALAIENADLYAALEQRYEDLKLDVAEWRRFLALG